MTKKTTKQKQNELIEQNVNEQNNIDDINIDELLRGLDKDVNEQKTKTKTKRTKKTKLVKQLDKTIEQNVNELITNNNKQNKIINEIQKNTNKLITSNNTLVASYNELIELNSTLNERILNLLNNTILNSILAYNDNDIEKIVKTLFGSNELMYNNVDDINTNLNELVFGKLKQLNLLNYNNSIVGILNKLIQLNIELKLNNKRLNERLINILAYINNSIVPTINNVIDKVLYNNNGTTNELNTIQLNTNVLNNGNILVVADITYNNSKILFKYLLSMVMVLLITAFKNGIKRIMLVMFTPIKYINNVVMNTITNVKRKIELYKLKRKYQKQNRISKRIQKLYDELNELNSIQ